MKRKKLAFRILLGVIALSLIFVLWVRLSTFHPEERQAEVIVGGENMPLLQPGDTVKVLNYNVQYMASKNYVFWYDMPGDAGPDSKPSREHVMETIDAVANLIIAEAPDVILLQEINDGAARTYYFNQLDSLLARLPEAYRCHSSAFYWKADFVPHEHIMGPVGMKLSTISKYKIDQSIRHQLPLFPKDIVSQQFYFRRAILETRLPVAGGGHFYALNTHLDAFAHGTNVMEKQIQKVDAIISDIEKNNQPWAIGGDFNLLPPGLDQSRMPDYLKPYYRPRPETTLLYEKYLAIPSQENITGPDYQKWYTHLANHPDVTEPNKTIDYIFYDEKLQLIDSYVRQHDTLEISDHLPIIAVFRLPE